MDERQQTLARLEELENELLRILAKTVIVFTAFLSVLWWTIASTKTAVMLVVSIFVLVGFLFLLVRWCVIYFRLRKEFYVLDKRYKTHADASTDSKEGDTPLIVFRRH